MAFCPFAVQQIIPESNTQGRINPTTLIFHEAVSSADSLYGYWTTPGVELESHFYIGRTGILYQFMDTNVRADANVSANAFAISVETWDNGGDINAPWNDAQLATAKRLAAWCRDTHGIPSAAPARWNSGGIGGHNWFANEWAGGARACPGPNRSIQIRNQIIPFASGGGSWNGESDMTPDEHNMLMSVLEKVTRINAFLAESANAPGGQTVHDAVWAVGTKVEAVDAKIDKLTVGGVDGAKLATDVAAKVNPELDKAVRSAMSAGVQRTSFPTV